MSKQSCTVYVRSDLTESRLDEIAAYLSDISRPQVRLNRARYWSIWVFGRPIHVSVDRTEDVLWDCEDEMLELGLLPEDVPYRIALGTGCGQVEDHELLQRLRDDLASLFDGIPTEPTR